MRTAVVEGARARGVVAFAIALVTLMATAATGLDEPATRDPADKEYALFGNGARFVGDVNGDGFGDVVVGASHYDTSVEPPTEPFQGEGRAYLYLGGADGLGATPAWSKDPTNGVAARFGIAIAGVGDLNSDGRSDVLIGAPGVSKVYLYLGTPSGLADTPIWEEAGTPGSRFGSAVARAGDLDADGIIDVLIGGDNPGTVHIYPGVATAALLAAAPLWSQSRNGLTGAGVSMAAMPDISGDGIPEVAIGFYGYGSASGEPEAEGRAYIFRGAADTGAEEGPAWFVDPPGTDTASRNFGRAIAVGDFNGDGKTDLLVGATGHASRVGKAFLYRGPIALGTPAVTGDAAEWSYVPQTSGEALFGRDIAVGDVSGDGIDDAVIGAEAEDFQRGCLRVFLGGPSALGAQPLQSACGEMYSRMGRQVSVGDIDDDGTADLLAGAPTYSSGDFVEEGIVYAWVGNDLQPPGTPIITLPRFQTSKTFTVRWSAAAGADGTDPYDVVVSSAPYDGPFGSPSNVATSNGARSVQFTGSPGRTYCFTVYAEDDAGNRTSARRCTAVPLNDRALSGGGWTRESAAGAYLGTFSQTKVQGAVLEREGVEAKRLAVIVSKCPACGAIKVFRGSTLLDTVSLQASSLRRKVLIVVDTANTVRSGKVRIKNVSDEKVMVEGLGVSRD